MMPLVLDLETIPLQSSLDAQYPRAEFSPPSNYKSDEAINNFHFRNEAEWHQKREKECSINPRLGRILCFGYAGINGEPSTLYALSEADEAELLRNAWVIIAAHGGRVVTWNGGFDLRWLVIRSLACGVAPMVDAATIREWFKKYAVFSHFDVKAVLLNWSVTDMLDKKEGLDTWAKFFGLAGKPDEIDGSWVYFLFKDGQHDTIQSYCKSDVANTKAMYQKVGKFFVGSV